MSNTKKIALMSTLVLLLVVAAVFNFVLAGTRSATVGAAGGDGASMNFFTSHRAERNSTRSEEFVQLDGIIAAYASDTQEYAEAVAAKQKMVQIMEDELVIETMIRAMGFSDAVVAIGADSENINIFINSSELNADTVMKIFSIFEDEKGIRNGNIIIMPIYAES